jgi:hypothetical protein
MPFTTPPTRTTSLSSPASGQTSLTTQPLGGPGIAGVERGRLGREDRIFIGGNGERHLPREQHPRRPERRSPVLLHDASDRLSPQHARRDTAKYLLCHSPRTSRCRSASAAMPCISSWPRPDHTPFYAGVRGSPDRQTKQNGGPENIGRSATKLGPILCNG